MVSANHKFVVPPAVRLRAHAPPIRRRIEPPRAAPLVKETAPPAVVLEPEIIAPPPPPPVAETPIVEVAPPLPPRPAPEVEQVETAPIIEAPPLEQAVGPHRAIRRGLVIKPHGDEGEIVVKDPITSEYYHLGAIESFLLLQLDGNRAPHQICEAYEKQFEQPLSAQELEEFVVVADEMHLLQPLTSDAPVAQRKSSDQSLLYLRRSVFDPDSLLNWLEPKIRFIWTPLFVTLSSAAMLCALMICCLNAGELVSRFGDAFTFKTLFIAWLALLLATTLHEFAHGLTCKHFGGEVHEVGFFLIYFIPAMYANVSDAWLFKERSKRLWVTLAGGWCDLCVWALAVFTWRLTMQDTLINYIAFLLIPVCGARSFFNFNPLLKLDGYYLLSDIAAIPNLRQRGWDHFMAHIRWLLWGAPRPVGEERGTFLLAFGATAWVYSVTFLVLMLVAMVWWLGDSWGGVGSIAACSLGVVVMKSQFSGISNGEFTTMIKTRGVRLAGWGLGLFATAAVLTLVPMEERAAGSFQLRSVSRAELRAPTASFLRDVNADEGTRVTKGAIVARLEIPELTTQIAQKKAEIAESEAKLRLYTFGPRNSINDATFETQIRKAELDAEIARLNKLREEQRFLEERGDKLSLRAPVAGVISTQRLKEKIGQYFKEGDLVALVEEPAVLEAEVAVPEQDAAHVKHGQKVHFKARAIPFAQLEGVVDRVAPSAIGPDPKENKLQSTVPVYCTISNEKTELRPGMTGFARIDCGKRAMGRVLFDRVLRYFRTEFWW